MPFGLLLLLGVVGAGIAYELSQSNDDKTPPRASSYIPGKGKTQAKIDALKSKLDDYKRRAAQGDEDAGKVINDVKTFLSNLKK